MTTLSCSLTALLGHGDMRCAAPSAASASAGPRVGCCVVPAAVATRAFVGCRGGSARASRVFSGGVQGEREGVKLAHFSGRNSVPQLPQRSWRCFADPEKTEIESVAEPPKPSCCADSAEKGDSVTATEVKEEAATSGSSGQVFESYGPGKQGNRLIALASVTVATGLFLFGRFGAGSPGLSELAATSISYQEALSNGRPTVVEFYADWCEVCKETAHDVYDVEQEYKDQINFVMLNVDNSKWEEELDEFGVEGIPHFAFLDKENNEEGNIVGRLPRKILKENLAALARGDATVPHSRVVGQFSNADSKQAPDVGPRSHSQMNHMS